MRRLLGWGLVSLGLTVMTDREVGELVDVIVTEEQHRKDRELWARRRDAALQQTPGTPNPG